MFWLAISSFLTLQTAPKPVVGHAFCFPSLFAEPKVGCRPFNRNETAGPLFDPLQKVVYVGGTDGYLHVVEPLTGFIQKRILMPAPSQTAPTLAGNVLLIGTDQGHIMAYDRAELELKWQQKLDSELANSMITDAQRAYALSGLGTLYALDLDSGHIIWEKRSALANLPLSKLSNPLLLGKNKIAWGTNLGKLEFLNTDTGALLFDVLLGDRKKPYPDIAADPILLSGNQIAVASFNQGVHIINAENGQILWSSPITQITQMASENGLLLLGGPKKITALELNTKKIRWNFSYLKGSPTPLVVKNSAIYFSSDKDALYVLDLNTGKPLDTLGSGLGFAANLDFSSDHTLFALSTAGYLYVYDGREKTARSRSVD